MNIIRKNRAFVVRGGGEREKRDKGQGTRDRGRGTGLPAGKAGDEGRACMAWAV